MTKREIAFTVLRENANEMKDNVCPAGVKYTGVEDMEHAPFKVRDGDQGKAWCCFCNAPLIQQPLSYWHRTEGMEPGWYVDDGAVA